MWLMVRRAATAAAVAVSALVVVAADLPNVSSGRPWLAMLQRGAGVALVIGAGMLALVPRPALVGVAALTALATGAAYLVGRPGRLEGAGIIAVVVVTPLLLVLVVMLSGPSQSRLEWPLAIAVAAAVISVVRVLVYEPLADIDCVGHCGHNPILVSANVGLAHKLGLLGAAAILLVAVSVVWRAIQSLRSGRSGGPVGRAGRLCVAAAAIVLGVDGAVRLASDTVAVPGHIIIASLVVALTASVLVAGALILTALDPLIARHDVARVAHLLARADATADVQTVFRDGFGDPGLRVGYWVDGAGYLDEDGEPVDPSGGAQTELTARGAPMAVIVHTRAAVPSELVTQQLGARARLAIHNEALTFELNRSAAEVARSRRRIVDVSDSARRRLERDLHDGAQQRLLALSFELRRGERAALAVHDDHAAVAFDSANALAHRALEQLRGLAHGIHPATLSGAGLHDALSELAASSDRNVSITIEATDPLPASVEATLYRVAAAAVTGAPNGATLHIAVRRHGQTVVLTVDGVHELPQAAVDRAAAVGGTCNATTTSVEVVVPCGS